MCSPQITIIERKVAACQPTCFRKSKVQPSAKVWLKIAQKWFFPGDTLAKFFLTSDRGCLAVPMQYELFSFSAADINLLWRISLSKIQWRRYCSLHQRLLFSLAIYVLGWKHDLCWKDHIVPCRSFWNSLISRLSWVLRCVCQIFTNSRF